jgi:hypothetical protein
MSVEAILARWASNGEVGNAPLDPAVEHAFELLHGCAIPAALKALLRRANGHGEPPSPEFRFLSVEEYYCPRDGVSPSC